MFDSFVIARDTSSFLSHVSLCAYLDLILSMEKRPGPEVIKLFPCSTQLSMTFILLINVKMPTNVQQMPTSANNLTFMSRKNSVLGLSEPEKCCISGYFYTY